MKKKGLIMVLMVALILLVGCGTDPLQDDIMSYTNESLPKLAKLEVITMDAYDKVTGDNYTDDETTYSTIRDEVMPASLKLIDAAESVTPESEELKAIHEEYVEALNIQHSAFGIILSGLENQDYEKLSNANEKLSKARKGMRQYEEHLKKLASEHNVEFESNN